MLPGLTLEARDELSPRPGGLVVLFFAWNQPFLDDRAQRGLVEPPRLHHHRQVEERSRVRGTGLFLPGIPELRRPFAQRLLQDRGHIDRPQLLERLLEQLLQFLHVLPYKVPRFVRPQLTLQVERLHETGIASAG